MRIQAALGQVWVAPVLSEPDCPCSVSPGEKQGLDRIANRPPPHLPVSTLGTLGAHILGVRSLLWPCHSPVLGFGSPPEYPEIKRTGEEVGAGGGVSVAPNVKGETGGG